MEQIFGEGIYTIYSECSLPKDAEQINCRYLVKVPMAVMTCPTGDKFHFRPAQSEYMLCSNCEFSCKFRNVVVVKKESL
jgi:hypothetical protein